MPKKINVIFIIKISKLLEKNTICIYNINFNFEDNIIKFIRHIRTNKKIKIDFLGINDKDIIFASKKYLHTIDKNIALEYLKNKRNGSLEKLSPSIYQVLKY